MLLDLRLEYIGNGQFRCRSKLDFELCSKELEIGEKLRSKLTRQRSVRQNNYFHALIECAWENQRGGPQQPSWKHLKSWLLIRADHCVVKQFDPGAITKEVARHFREQFDTVDFTTDGEKIYMKTAKSVRFGKGGPGAEEMSAIVDKVIAVICTEIVPGLSPDDLIDMAKKRAA